MLLGTSVSSGSYSYTYPAAQSGNNGSNNFVQCSGQTINLNSNTVAVGLLGAVWSGMDNEQTKNGTVTLNFTDGTIKSFNETFGPWCYKNVGTGTLEGNSGKNAPPFQGAWYLSFIVPATPSQRNTPDS